MGHTTDELSSDRDLGGEAILQHARAFWAGLPKCLGDAEKTHRGLLEGLRAEFEDVACRRPVDLNRVASLTAQAALLLSGKRFF